MVCTDKIAPAALACFLTTAAIGMSTPVLASETGAFIGGIFATKLLGNMRERTEAENRQAAAAERAAQRPVAPAPAPTGAPAQKSVEQRLAELDKLAAGGYITPEEYKARKQQIIDSI
jgi:hypothetical protein